MNDTSIKKVYNNYSYFYNLLFNKALNQGRKKSIELMNVQPGEKIIEIGVGTGLSFKYYPQKFSLQITGIDLSKKMLQKAYIERKKYKNLDITLKLENAENTPFDSNLFDKTMIMHTYSVTPNPEKLLHEALRICKPTGSIYIVNHFSHFKKSKLSLTERSVSSFGRFIGFRSDFSYKKYIEEPGLNVESIDSANLFSLTQILHIKKANNLHVLAKKRFLNQV